MSPRIVGCLLLSIISGAAAFIWVVASGWGILAALLAYSLFGAIVIIVAVSVLVLLESAVAKAHDASAPRAQRRYATAHNG